ncbi:MAG TPA: energy transducer TonB, partial [Rhodanobacteraceae bacterium]|nr:energy transducer TonB [Rhodanobacteraceae bacterium]
MKIERPPPMPPPPAPPPPQEQTVMSTPAAPPRPPAPPPPPADVAPSVDISYKNRNPPKYPIQALRQGHQGEVLLAITINAAGAVVDVKVQKSSGYRELDRAAEEAARGWRFNPGIQNGKPSGGVVLVPVNFSLAGLQ